MRSTCVWPSATRPAITRLAEARRSVAITVAPDNRGTPCTTAVWPSISIFAPSRTSSLTCMKRFSKIVSLITALPSAMQFTAINCACMSVGNAGYSLVRKPTALSRPSARTRIQSLPASISAPASRSLSISASR